MAETLSLNERIGTTKSRAVASSKDDITSADKALPSLNEIRSALPEHVWHPSLSAAFFYVALDALYVVMAFAVASVLCLLHPLLWPIYWIVQGTTFWAIFVLGHDCGHGSFSSSKELNDFCGLLFHTFIMVPYYPWKLSHRHHHRNTGHLHNDEVFKPVPVVSKLWRHQFLDVMLQYTTGASWWLYLLGGYPGTTGVSHLMLSSHVDFCKKYGVVTRYQKMQMWASRLGLLVWACFLFYTFEFKALAKFYIAPVVVCDSWLVLVTFLHHFDEHSEYTSDSWTFVKGALNSVDRDYGIFQYWTHNIGTHQVHHLFSEIPHYYLHDATKAFRAKYPHLVRSKDGFPVCAYPSHIRHYLSNFYFTEATKKVRWGKIQ
eukprot:gb/GEZN01006798.1/.p1 GENE.gb/GEZN01006798.1/~~gb/GEZN01006798.1/.p1  ORF type:complete len:387 (+),score=15.15 gb/GEZN01006798.1/:41-1162(+)